MGTDNDTHALIQEVLSFSKTAWMLESDFGRPEVDSVGQEERTRV